MSTADDKEVDMNAAEALLGIQGSPAVAAAATIPVQLPGLPPPTSTSASLSATAFPTTSALSETSYAQYRYPTAYHNTAVGALGASMVLAGGDTSAMAMPALPGANIGHPGVAAAAPQQAAASAHTSRPGKTKRTTKEPKSRRDKFPQKLMEILSNEDYADTISWLPHGRSFIIHSPERLTESILPHYLKECKFSSFTRKLYRWGFRQISKGPDAESFFHKMFRRDKPNLCSMITCGKEIRDGCPELHGGINAESLMRMEQAELRDNLIQQRKDAIARQQLAHHTALMNHAEFAHSAAAAHAANVASIGSRGLPPATVDPASGYAEATGYTGAGYARYDLVTGLPIGFHPGADSLAAGGEGLPGVTRTSGVPPTRAGMSVAGIGAFTSGALGPSLDDGLLTTLATNADAVEVQKQLDEMGERILLLKRHQLQALHERHQELRRLELQEALRIQQQQASAASAYAAALAAPPTGTNLTTMASGVAMSNTVEVPGTSLAPQHSIPRSVDVSVPAPAQAPALATFNAATVPAPAVSAINSNKADSTKDV